MYRALWNIRKIKARTVPCTRLLGSNGLQPENGEPKSVKPNFNEKDQLATDESQIQTEVGPRPTKMTTFEKRRAIFSNLNKELQTDYRIKQMNRYYNDELVQRLEHCEGVPVLLETIEPRVGELRTDHLEVIYEKINMLCVKAKKQMPTQEYEELKEIVRSSPAFVMLLARTMQLIRELDNSCLVKQLLTFRLLDQDPATKIMAATCQMLKHKVNDLQLEEIKDCLRVLASYSFDSRLDNFFNTFYQALLLVASGKILSNRYDYEDVELAICFFVVLTRWGNFEQCYNASIRLVRVLLLEENQLDFHQATRLLRQIKQIEFPCPFPYPDFNLFKQLISKCNATIYETLALWPSEEKIAAYLNDVHQRLDPSSFLFHNLYDYKILSIISPVLSPTFAEHDKQALFHLIHNHYKLDIFDERLLRQFYELICSDRYPEEFAGQFDPYALYSMFTSLRLPFVEPEHLAKLVFNLNDQKVRRSLNSRIKTLKILIKLALTEVRDEQLLQHFFRIIEQNKTEFLQSSDWYTQIRRGDIVLAQICLSLFGQSEIESKVGGLLRQIWRSLRIHCNRPREFADCKVVGNVMLSNGVSIHSFAVYDQSKNDLVSLLEYRSQFLEIDRIPLAPHQQMLVFVAKPNIKGTCFVYESNNLFQLKRVLNQLNIKPIEIYSDEIAFPRKAPNHLVELALEACSDKQFVCKS